MFSMGEKIVYPMHGAGIIQSIEEKEVLGQKKKYYIMWMSNDNINVMIPIDSIDDFKIRKIISYSEYLNVIDRLKETDIDELDNWGVRYRNNVDKIKKGDVYDLADVIKSLAIREKKKSLSSGENRIYELAKEILFSELTLVTGLSCQDIDSAVEEAIFGKADDL